MTANGYMGFGLPQFLRRAPIQWDSIPGFLTRDDFSVLAPHWTNCDYDATGGTTPVYYQIYERVAETANNFETYVTSLYHSA